MPYKSNADLPKEVRDALPEAAQSIFREVFNSTQKRGSDESSSAAQSWAAVKTAGYGKDESTGKWRRVRKGEHMEVNIAKTDAKRKMVFGFFSVNKVGAELVEDLQGDLIETEELEKAAYDYVLNARVQGEGHLRKGVGRLVESVVLTYEKQAAIEKCLADQGIEASIDLGCEGWFGGFKVDDDEVWKAIEKGDYPAFSIGGSGKRIPLED